MKDEPPQWSNPHQVELPTIMFEAPPVMGTTWRADVTF
jgi:hypothetical protein